MDEVSAGKLMYASALAFGHSFGVSGFTDTISRTIEAMKGGFKTDNEFEHWGDYIRQTLAEFEPQAFREVSGYVTGERTRVVKTGEYDESKSPEGQVMRELKALYDNLRQGVGASGGGTIAHRLNMFTGEPLIREAWPMNPYKAVPNMVGPWASEIKRLDGAGLKEMPDWIGQQQTPSTGMDPLKLEAPALRLDAREINRRTILMTQEVELGGEKLIGGLDELVKSDIYKGSSDAYKADLIRQRFGEYRKAAETRLLLENESLRKDYERKQGRSIIQKTPEKGQESLRMELDVRLGKGKVGTNVVP